MQCLEVSQEANTLHVKFKYTHSIDKEMLQRIESSKYICGALYAEFEFAGSRGVIYSSTSYSNCYLTVSVRFHKLLDNDDLTYKIKCKFESGDTKLLVKELRICDDNWRQIAFISRNSLSSSTVWSYTFGIVLNCEIIEKQSVFSSLFDDTQSADFSLCGDTDSNGSVKFHKTILSAFSPVLQRMLAGEWKETQEGSLDMQGVTLETLKHLKEYIYLDTLPETGLQDLCVLGSYYMMPKLVVQCCAKMLNKLTIDNAMEMAEFASRYKVEPLYIAILKAMLGDNAKIDKLVFNSKSKWNGCLHKSQES